MLNDFHAKVPYSWCGNLDVLFQQFCLKGLIALFLRSSALLCSKLRPHDRKTRHCLFSWYSSATQSSSPPNKCTSGVLISCPTWKISTKCKTNQLRRDIKKRKRGHTVSVKLCRILRFLSCSLPSLNRRYKRSCQSQGLFCRCWIRSLILRAQKVHPVTFVNKNYIHSTFSRIKNQTYIWTQSLRGGIITSSTTG